MAPPRKTAAHTWMCTWLADPDHTRGDTHSANDAGEPLHAHQLGEDAVRSAIQPILV